MTNVAVFDMNETTLDLAPVRVEVNRQLDNPDGFTIWFQKLLQLSMLSVVTDEYQDFSELAPPALTAVAESQGVELADGAWASVGSAMAGIAPFPDVVGGLTQLREAGWMTMALTNSATCRSERRQFRRARRGVDRSLGLVATWNKATKYLVTNSVGRSTPLHRW